MGESRAEQAQGRPGRRACRTEGRQPALRAWDSEGYSAEAGQGGRGHRSVGFDRVGV